MQLLAFWNVGKFLGKHSVYPTITRISKIRHMLFRGSYWSVVLSTWRGRCVVLQQAAPPELRLWHAPRWRPPLPAAMSTLPRVHFDWLRTFKILSSPTRSSVMVGRNQLCR